MPSLVQTLLSYSKKRNILATVNFRALLLGGNAITVFEQNFAVGKIISAYGKKSS